MGRGGSKASSGGGTGGVKESDIKSTKDLVSERGASKREVDEVLAVSQDITDMYGKENIGDFQVAEMKGAAKTRVMAYYDGQNVAINENYFDAGKMTSAYDDCVAKGFHPSRGDKTGIEAVTAHELGHMLTDKVGAKMGYDTNLTTLNTVAGAILNEAKGEAGHKSINTMAAKISGYAKKNHAETIAEAFCDVYCNGNKATKESTAIVNVINRYLKS